MQALSEIEVREGAHSQGAKSGLAAGREGRTSGVYVFPMDIFLQTETSFCAAAFMRNESLCLTFFCVIFCCATSLVCDRILCNSTFFFVRFLCDTSFVQVSCCVTSFSASSVGAVSLPGHIFFA